MCRIAGVIAKNFSVPQLQNHVTLMCESMKHGGPDDFGVVVDEERKVCLGNRRLSILDLSQAGHQPMLSDNSQIVIAYNGEIYNFKLLRSELAQHGFKFKSESDTEVIIKAYEFWGEGAFEKLNGIFAFCLHDKRKNCVYLVRDHSGVKPLYYNANINQLVFASEVKAFAHSGFSLNENWKIYYLAFGHIPEPFTTLKNVYTLPKGSFLKYELTDGSFKISPYFEFSAAIEIIDENEAIVRIREELTKAIKLQLISDTSIGVLFSGGLDSSIITLLADNYTKGNLTSISANFNEIDFSESPHRRAISERVLADKHEHLITYRDFVYNFETVMKCMDQPTNDGINTWFICKCAKENGIKSVLSGLGADELFGGYPSFDRIRKIQNMGSLSKALIKSARFLKNTKLKRLYYLSFQSPVGEYLCLRGLYTPDVIAELLGLDIQTVINCLQNIPLNDSIRYLNDEERASWFEMNMYMQNQLLKDTDFMSMSHGVEVRVPFLDVNFIKLVSSIHPSIRFGENQKKRLLIEAYKDELPSQIWNRSKMGFTFPFQEWIRKNKEIASPDRYQNKKAKKLMHAFGENKLHWTSALALYKIFNAS
ncbi:asparagine synthase (glutamine-hydrolyzing) [Pedobacter sp. KR3-3]|uniref:asparagine synthase (glutamine-hydrolyzing) n=1 Tax=Pedobacter albus TaxID=3113905 RepID=A0ABU7I6M1_9SPHI|nr:asparagine synthase (glutamine-hydrolyzing) [Pedobacter sp. KR3-3]MEE1945123.1 asparagine synthase (glutamine-hydrolyzing) [Pedobacter sp. KR3-3]